MSILCQICGSNTETDADAINAFPDIGDDSDCDCTDGNGLHGDSDIQDGAIQAGSQPDSEAPTAAPRKGRKLKSQALPGASPSKSDCDNGNCSVETVSAIAMMIITHPENPNSVCSCIQSVILLQDKSHNCK